MTLCSDPCAVKRKRSVILSITHILISKRISQRDVRETAEAAPDDGISGWCVPPSGQVASELRELRHIPGDAVFVLPFARS